MPKFKIRANVIAEQWDGSEGQLQDLASEHSLRFAFAPGFTTVVVGERDGLEAEKTLNPGDYLVWVSKTDPFPAVILEELFETFYHS
jgi:hypothetical protein